MKVETEMNPPSVVLDMFPCHVRHIEPSCERALGKTRAPIRAPVLLGNFKDGEGLEVGCCAAFTAIQAVY